MLNVGFEISESNKLIGLKRSGNFESSPNVVPNLERVITFGELWKFPERMPNLERVISRRYDEAIFNFHSWF